MSFIEVETWRIKVGNEAAHEEMIRAWFSYVKANHAGMFSEWKSARYYRETDIEGDPTGRFVMLFEFNSVAGHHAYKERRKDWSGPYEEYRKVDPYGLFEEGSVEMTYWEPQEVENWFDFG